MDPKYVDVIVNRYIAQAGTADKVFLVRDGKIIPFAEVEKL